MMLVDEARLRAEIVQVGRLLYEKGLICASDGNVSARLGPGRILITPSGLHKGLLAEHHLLIVDEAGQVVQAAQDGPRRLKPTSELPMHLEAYRRRSDAQAVVHAHPPITVALSIAGIPMNECLLPEVIVFLGLVPTSQYATPSSEENVRAIRDLIGNHDGLILQRHGSLAVGDSPLQAFMRTETIEQNARIGFMLAQLGVSNPLPADEVRKLLAQRARMGLMRPGETDDFCDQCGVCHTAPEHVPTLQLAREPRPTPAPLTANVVENVDPAVVRMLVSQVVRSTLGGSLT